MEVHTHTHTARKKWTHYFWEFLMLFLAVFCGFLAENQREHMVEHNRAKQYATSLLEEVVGDTAAINETLSYYTQRSASLDTLIELLTKNDIKQVPCGWLYYFTGKGMNNNGMAANHTTLQQLKSAGALRYFTNRKLIKCIGEYDQVLQAMEDNERGSFSILMEARKPAFKIFDLKYFKKINISNANTIVSHLVTYDPIVLVEFTNWVNHRNRNFHVILIPNLRTVQQKARELIALLKSEYHFEK